ncbi:hypothetical protein [Bacillus sp. 3255]|uniref:hypothetical protein n=1 Tax=Bacillus sp. 3255 TaxID=2817904 RepID=UPI00285EC3D8|nr:hypothetical protein [Bacillus sp. 3255]MDR6883044.1 hypothetical protein [Bacillus sp. 3255]
MGKREGKQVKKIKINFIPVEGDVLEAIASAVNTNVSSVLTKHGAKLTIGLNEIIRNHAKV